MKHNPPSADFSQPATPLSASGQLIGWVVFGGLVLVGFFFGVVTGYEKPKPVQLAKADKENAPPPTIPISKPAAPVQPTPQPIVTAPPKEEIKAPPADPPPADPPKADPPKVDKVDPPKPPAPMKKEEPKKQTLKPVSFQREVLPILRSHCLNCHGATGKPKGDVNLTSIANMMKSRGGKILVPGKPDDSDIYTSITEREMPDGGRPKPTPKELMTLRNWILTGAKPRRRPHSRFARA